MESKNSYLKTEKIAGMIFVIFVIGSWIEKNNHVINNLLYNMPIVIIEIIVFVAAIWQVIRYWLKSKERKDSKKLQEEIFKSEIKKQEKLEEKKKEIRGLAQELSKIYQETEPSLKKRNNLKTKKELEEQLEKLEGEKFNIPELYEIQIEFITNTKDKINKITTFFQSEEKKELEKKKIVEKELDLSKGYFLINDLDEQQISILEEKGFEKSREGSFDNKSSSWHLINRRSNETSTHAYFVYKIRDFLKELNVKFEIFETKNPDLIFEINGEKWAIEVETGSFLTKKDVFEEKIKERNQQFKNNWMLVITDSNNFYIYKQYHDLVFNRLEIKQKLREIIQPDQVHDQINEGKT